MRARTLLLPITIVLGSLAFSPTARAGIPIIYGHGPTVAKVADLPSGHPAIAQFGHGSAVGYRYDRFHIYWCDLWTWGGQFCIFNDNGWMPLGNDAKKAAELAGVPGLSKPILYHFPLGWILIATVVFGSVLWERLKSLNSPAAQAQKLLQDPSYQEAAKLLAGSANGYDAALAHLTGRGIEPRKAEANLLLLATQSHVPSPPQTAPPVYDEPEVVE